MELLFDDAWIDRKAGVRRVMGVPRKEEKPVLEPEMPWEQERIQAYNALFFDEQEEKYKLWYRARALEDVKRNGNSSAEAKSGKVRVFLCYAESQDGIRWVRPSLECFEFLGSRDNNIVAEISEGDSAFFNVVKDVDDPNPARRYKAIGFDHSVTSAIRGIPAGTVGVCVRYSPDGLSWPDGPKLIMSTTELTDSDCILGHREPTTGKWVAFFRPRTHPKRRFIGYAASEDFDHWRYPRMLLTPDAGDDEWTEFYGLTVAGLGRWRVGCLWVYHNNPEYSPMTTELVYSRDGINYRRAMPGVEFLSLGPVGAFDSRMISTVSLITREGECLLYYNGYNREHGSDRGMRMPPGRIVEGEKPQTAVGLARIPGQNFCGLRADFDGLVETKWLCNYGEMGVQAYVEMDEDGWLQAEILDQYGNVIPGWDRKTSRIYPDDDGRTHFSWGNKELVGKFGQVSEAGGKIGHVIKLRFYLHKTNLFGFQVGEDDAIPPYE